MSSPLSTSQPSVPLPLTDPSSLTLPVSSSIDLLDHLSRRDYRSLLLHFERVELFLLAFPDAAASGSHPSLDYVWSLEMLSAALLRDFSSAKFVWQRACDHFRSSLSNSFVDHVWRPVNALVKADIKLFYSAASELSQFLVLSGSSGSSFSSHLSPFVVRLVESVRLWVAEAIERCYASIAMETAAMSLGLDSDGALQWAVSRGWSVDESSGSQRFLQPKRSQTAEATQQEEEMEIITRFVLQLENQL